jgi:hypothetical protein
MKPDITLNLDPANPGHFFACCGLLEIAHRLTGHAEGWFEMVDKEDRKFHIDAETSINEIIDTVRDAGLTAENPADRLYTPLVLALDEPIRIDWWTSAHDAGPELQTWTAKFDLPAAAFAMKENMVARGEKTLFFRKYVSKKGNEGRLKEPSPSFFFDSTMSGSGKSIDAGYSLYALREKVGLTTFPNVEFLSLIGLQRCRPRSGERVRSDPKGRWFQYQTWSQPSPVLLTQSFVAGLNPGNAYLFKCEQRVLEQPYRCYLQARKTNHLP